MALRGDEWGKVRVLLLSSVVMCLGVADGCFSKACLKG